MEKFFVNEEKKIIGSATGTVIKWLQCFVIHNTFKRIKLHSKLCILFLCYESKILDLITPILVMTHLKIWAHFLMFSHLLANFYKHFGTLSYSLKFYHTFLNLLKVSHFNTLLS